MCRASTCAGREAGGHGDRRHSQSKLLAQLKAVVVDRAQLGLGLRAGVGKRRASPTGTSRTTQSAHRVIQAGDVRRPARALAQPLMLTIPCNCEGLLALPLRGARVFWGRSGGSGSRDMADGGQVFGALERRAVPARDAAPVGVLSAGQCVGAPLTKPSVKAGSHSGGPPLVLLTPDASATFTSR